MENTFEVDEYESHSYWFSVPNAGRHNMHSRERILKAATKLLELKLNKVNYILVKGTTEVLYERLYPEDKLFISCRFWKNVQNKDHQEILKNFVPSNNYNIIRFPRPTDMTRLLP